MRKTVSITLGGILFTVEEDAYRDLDAYLSAIRTHFTRYADPDEIVADIESRIAEEFAGMLSSRKKVITQADVAALIRRLGTVEDFAEFEGEHVDASPGTETGDAKKEETKGWKMPQGRLYRDVDDQILGGVGAGLANYVGIDPTIMRLLFVLFAFLSNGFGILLYIVLWVILPEAKTPTEKMEMARERVTLSAIQQRLQKSVSSEKTKSTVRAAASLPVLIIRRTLEVIGNVLAAVLPVLATIIGVLIIIACALAIAGITMLLLILMTSPDRALVDLPLRDIMGGAQYALFLFSLYGLLFFPVIVLLMLGASFVDRKNAFNGRMLLVLVALWSIAFAGAGSLAFSAAPEIRAAADLRLTTATRIVDVEEFDRIRIDGGHQLILEQADTTSVTVETNVRLLPALDAVVEDGVLRLRRTSGEERCLFFCPASIAILRVRAPDVTGVEAADWAHAVLQEYAGEELTLTLDHNASMRAAITVERLIATGRGAARLTLMGTAEHARIDFADRAVLQGEAFRAGTTDVSARDASRVLLDTARRDMPLLQDNRDR